MNPVATTASHAVDHVKDAASTAKGGFLELGVQVAKLLNTIHAKEIQTVDNALDFVGLQRRESVLRPFFIFAAGAVVGSSVTLLLAPTTGKKLRTDILAFMGVAKPDEAEAAAGASVTKISEAPRPTTSAKVPITHS